MKVPRPLGLQNREFLNNDQMMSRKHRSFTAVRGGEILFRPQRDDAGRVNVIMRHIVMPLDVIEVDRSQILIG